MSFVRFAFAVSISAAGLAIGVAAVPSNGSTPASMDADAARVAKHAGFSLRTRRAGGLKLGRSTKGTALRRYGRPFESVYGRNTKARILRWRCGRGCLLEARFKRNRVQTVWAYGDVVRKRFRTAAGTYLGIDEASAETKDGGTFVDACTRAFSRRRGGLTLEIGSNGTRVNSLLMFTRIGGVLC